MEKPGTAWERLDFGAGACYSKAFMARGAVCSRANGAKAVAVTSFHEPKKELP
jgi:hypothetical protein